MRLLQPDPDAPWGVFAALFFARAILFVVSKLFWFLVIAFLLLLLNGGDFFCFRIIVKRPASSQHAYRLMR